jgi:hypothetical protein
MQAVHPVYRHQLISIESAERLQRIERVRAVRAGYRQPLARIGTRGRRLIVAFGAAVTLPGLLALLG